MLSFAILTSPALRWDLKSKSLHHQLLLPMCCIPKLVSLFLKSPFLIMVEKEPPGRRTASRAGCIGFVFLYSLRFPGFWVQFMHLLCWTLLAPQSGALRISAYRDFHPNPIPSQSTYSFREFEHLSLSMVI